MRRLAGILLIGLPVAVVSRLSGGPDVLIFVSAALSLIPLALWIGAATDQLAVRLGSSFGGLLNATFSNAAELIIAIFALRRGLIGLVKASITGSIIGNTLFNLGLSTFLGGVRHGPQKFAVKPVGRHAAMMILAVSGWPFPRCSRASRGARPCRRSSPSPSRSSCS